MTARGSQGTPPIYLDDDAGAPSAPAVAATRLAKAFGGSPETWLGPRRDYDLARVQGNAGKIKL